MQTLTITTDTADYIVECTDLASLENMFNEFSEKGYFVGTSATITYLVPVLEIRKMRF